MLSVVRGVGRALTRDEVIKALRAAGLSRGPGTVSEALADLTAAGERFNRCDERDCRTKE